MDSLTTQKIITILPIDAQLKQELLDGFDSFEPSIKFKLERILWDAYYQQYEMKLQENIQKKL